MRNLREELGGSILLLEDVYYKEGLYELYDERGRSLNFKSIGYKRLGEEGVTLRLSVSRIYCYIENGLPLRMKDITDEIYWPFLHEGVYRWTDPSVALTKNITLSHRKVWEDHPELLEREGYYNEGPIEFKYRKGFYIVPDTNALIAVNPETSEAIRTYSLKPASLTKAERGEPLISNLANRSDRTTLLLHRAIASVACPIPERYLEEGKTIGEVAKGLEVDHIDFNCLNQDYRNLQWLTKQENLDRHLFQSHKSIVISSRWLSPKGEVVTFPSHNAAMRAIGASRFNFISTLYGWDDKEELNGWRVLEGKVEHKYKAIYDFLREALGPRAMKFRDRREGIAEVEIGEDSKITVALFTSFRDYYRRRNIQPESFFKHMQYYGPIGVHKGKSLMPVSVLDYLSRGNNFETFIDLWLEAETREWKEGERRHKYFGEG